MPRLTTPLLVVGTVVLTAIPVTTTGSSHAVELPSRPAAKRPVGVLPSDQTPSDTTVALHDVQKIRPQKIRIQRIRINPSIEHKIALVEIDPDVSHLTPVHGMEPTTKWAHSN